MNLQKIPLFGQFIFYIIVVTKENVCSYLRKECETMNKKQELINRIEKLTDAQFEMLIALYSQQEQEFVPDVPVERPTFLQPSL